MAGGSVCRRKKLIEAGLDEVPVDGIKEGGEIRREDKASRVFGKSLAEFLGGSLDRAIRAVSVHRRGKEAIPAGSEDLMQDTMGDGIASGEEGDAARTFLVFFGPGSKLAGMGRVGFVSGGPEIGREFAEDLVTVDEGVGSGAGLTELVAPREVLPGGLVAGEVGEFVVGAGKGGAEVEGTLPLAGATSQGEFLRDEEPREPGLPFAPEIEVAGDSADGFDLFCGIGSGRLLAG